MEKGQYFVPIGRTEFEPGESGFREEAYELQRGTG